MDVHVRRKKHNDFFFINIFIGQQCATISIKKQGESPPYRIIWSDQGVKITPWRGELWEIGFGRS
jgi:hypothetical protein